MENIKKYGTWKKKHSKKSYRRLIMKKESIIINDINIE
jgi:hypothetical protein